MHLKIFFLFLFVQIKCQVNTAGTQPLSTFKPEAEIPIPKMETQIQESRQKREGMLFCDLHQ